MFKAYDVFLKHDHSFNTIFATCLAILCSLFLGSILAFWGFFGNPVTWFIFLVLAVGPAIIYISYANETEFRTAYYKTWCDKIAGMLDRRKILRDFARKYHITDWKVKSESIKVDKRWKFHLDTAYMRRLTWQCDYLLKQIHQEYLDQLAGRDKAILDAKLATKNSLERLNYTQNLANEAEELLSQARVAGEIYRQRQNKQNKMSDLERAREAFNATEHDLQCAERDRSNLIAHYNEVTAQVAKIYASRYAKYAKSAIKRIHRIDGLNYVVDDFPNLDVHRNK